MTEPLLARSAIWRRLIETMKAVRAEHGCVDLRAAREQGIYYPDNRCDICRAADSALRACAEAPQLKLVDYVEHWRGCKVDGNGDPPHPCTCGLDTLLAACAEAPAEKELAAIKKLAKCLRLEHLIGGDDLAKRSETIAALKTFEAVAALQIENQRLRAEALAPSPDPEGERRQPPFIPHGQRCQADDSRGSDFGQCVEDATATVKTPHGSRWVCGFHAKHWPTGAAPSPDTQEPTEAEVTFVHAVRRDALQRFGHEGQARILAALGANSTVDGGTTDTRGQTR